MAISTMTFAAIWYTTRDFLLLRLFLTPMQALNTQADIDRRLCLDVRATNLTAVLKDIDDLIHALQVSQISEVLRPT